ncbi:transcription termination/antitermination NusG family protein [Algiphilus sp. W345]|uniref:Transcription termination/antitermination NusG family protein n=1 Tax=Banduia mediterranea TaxID=3075609 RepID=A0ABU2WH11_9GAMM|nr:transcription termination/antitermination NusG family protein [Algiphilus sp. W345]MDT0496362.1 transcription termination/antitermination NusG family protein [Algiphilus sp. W345]
MRRWYVVMTKPRQEQIALAQLTRQGYESYLPIVSERRREQGKYVNKRVPLFPRYLFVNLDTAVDNTAPIRSTVGCCGLVRFGLRLAYLPSGVLEWIQARCREGESRRRQASWMPGRRLDVLDGPFAGLDAVFAAASSHDRVIVLLKLLGASRPVELPQEHLRAV